MDTIRPVIFEPFTTAANEKSAVDAGRQAEENHRALLEKNVSRRRQRAASAEPGERIELLYLNALSIAESRNSVLKDDYDAKNFESLPQEEKLETLLRTIFLHAKLEKEELAFLGKRQSSIAPENMGEFLAKSYLGHIATRSGHGQTPDDEVTFLKNIISIQEQRRNARERDIIRLLGKHAEISKRNYQAIQDRNQKTAPPPVQEETTAPLLPKARRRPRVFTMRGGPLWTQEHHPERPARKLSWLGRAWQRVRGASPSPAAKGQQSPPRQEAPAPLLEHSVS